MRSSANRPASRVALALALTVAAGLGASGCRDDAPVHDRPTRTDLINRAGAPLTLIGPTPGVGRRAPDAVLHDGALKPVRLSSLKGTLLVLSVVPSIDTRVCEAQTHHMSDAIATMPPGTTVVTISRDLPFAQGRFAEEAMTKTMMLSDYKEREFGQAFGLEVAETGLLARSVWVIAADGTIVYRELVADQTQEPDYAALTAAIAAATPR